ncbi:MAG: response regulator transcription factor [Phycisphaeraceae bacterium]|nr:response regulator transcription factor [Phycisphaeraceae bacterium]
MTQSNANPGVAPTRRCRVLIVDNHPLVRQGLGRLINDESDMELCGEADSPAEGLKAIKQFNPDVAVVDLSFHGLDGIELIKDIKAQHPGLPVLVLSTHQESFYAQRTMKAGAMGYLMKNEAAERVIEGIRAVRQGRIVLSDVMSQFMLARATGGITGPAGSVEDLTDRELEVLYLIGQGKTTRQIADLLHLSIKTIETHRENIKQKLRLDNGTQLIHYAVQFTIEHE